MRLKVIGSNSSGNSYAIYNDTETLLIECGVRFEVLKQALDFKLSNVLGCLISHAHGDHCKYVKGVVNGGIDVYCLPATSEKFGFYSHRVNNILPGMQFDLGGFTILPVSLEHDVPCLGFYIRHHETGNFCFITDTYYCKYTFPDLNNVIIEANYCENILAERVTAGSEPQFLRDRVIQSHMSLQTCKEFLKANDLKKVHNIVLIHLSDRNSHAENFKADIKKQTTKNVHIADKGLDIAFNKSPF